MCPPNNKSFALPIPDSRTFSARGLVTVVTVVTMLHLSRSDLDYAPLTTGLPNASSHFDPNMAKVWRQTLELPNK